MVDGLQVLTVPLAFVSQLPGELEHTHVGYRFGQLTISQHTF